MTPGDLRKRRGAWYTPPDLVDRVVDAVVTPDWLATRPARRLLVVDPACGDGRFLHAVHDRVERLAGDRPVEFVGVDVDGEATGAAAARLRASGVGDGRLVESDALTADWGALLGGRRADLVIGNPPFLSQLAAATTRGGASPRGGGPYADAAAEFLALGADLADPAGGRLAFVLPQSLLAARDAEPIRRSIDERAGRIWAWWSHEHAFDAQVVACALAFEFGRTSAAPSAGGGHSWSSVVTDRIGVPAVDLSAAATAGTLGDRAELNANFRDEYYGMVPAVGDHAAGPPLITSGLIDPGRSRWGERAVRFAKRRFDAPRIDLALLDAPMRAWAARRLVPKVLVANQTSVIEAVADPGGEWLPGVPVVAAYPRDGVDVWEIAAVLTSPAASAWAWARRGGTGLSATTIRVGPPMLAALPWPAGSLAAAVDALRAGEPLACGAAVDAAYGLADDGTLLAWWSPLVTRALTRH